MRIELANLEHGRADLAHVYQPDELGSFDERVTVIAPVSVTGTVQLDGARIASGGNVGAGKVAADSKVVPGAKVVPGTEVFVNGHIETRAQVECDRCLQQIETPVNADFDLQYITGTAYESTPVAELTEDELSVSVFDGETIDVDEIVKEQILLAVPTRMLCRPDCKGICPDCGIDKNTGDCACATDEVDPRWAALKNLTSGK